MPNLQGPEKKQPPINMTKRSQRQDDLAPIHEGSGRSAGGYTVGNMTDPARFDNHSQNMGQKVTKHGGHQTGKGDGTRTSLKPKQASQDTPNQGETPGYPANVVNQMMLQHLQAIGQTPGPQQGTSLMQTPEGLGQPGAGLHMPGPGGPGQQGGQPGGQPGAGPGGPQAGGNPLEAFLGQVLNPRAAATSPQGAVPTLPGAPQGFDLYHMMQLLHLYQSLYHSMPVGGQSLPSGVPGPGY